MNAICDWNEPTTYGLLGQGARLGTVRDGIIYTVWATESPWGLSEYDKCKWLELLLAFLDDKEETTRLKQTVEFTCLLPEFAAYLTQKGKKVNTVCPLLDDLIARAPPSPLQNMEWNITYSSDGALLTIFRGNRFRYVWEEQNLEVKKVPNPHFQDNPTRMKEQVNAYSALFSKDFLVCLLIYMSIC